MDSSCSSRPNCKYETEQNNWFGGEPTVRSQKQDPESNFEQNNSEQIDKIEREDYEEENRLIQQCSEKLVNNKHNTSNDNYPISTNSSLASSSETIPIAIEEPVASTSSCNLNKIEDKESEDNDNGTSEESNIVTEDEPVTMYEKIIAACSQAEGNNHCDENVSFPEACSSKSDHYKINVPNSSCSESNGSSTKKNKSTSTDMDSSCTVSSKSMPSSLFLSKYCDDDSDDDEGVGTCTCTQQEEVVRETCISDNACSDVIEDIYCKAWKKRKLDSSSSNSNILQAKKLCKEILLKSDSSSSCSASGTGEQEWPPSLPTPSTSQSTMQQSPELQSWINQYLLWSHSERTVAIDTLISNCAAAQVRHMMKTIEPLFQRDFISLLPKELALTVLRYLEPKDLLRAAQTCRYWRFLADDNLLWKEQCRRVGIISIKKRPHFITPCSSPWKAAYMKQYIIENNWLTSPVNQPIIMRGHEDHVITCLQFYGNRILSGSDDTTLKIWSAVTGRCLRTLIGHSGGVWSSQMVGRLVISGSTDRTLRVWDAKTGTCLKTLSGHTSTVRCMHLHQNIVVSGSRDATLRVWSIPEGKCLRVLVGHLAAVRCVQYDGKVVVSGAYDYFVKVWNPISGECIHTLAGHTNRVYSLQFDGIHIVSGSLDTSIRVWDVETGQLKHTLIGHQSLTSGMELHSNILVSGNADSTVKVWDITTGHCIHTLSGRNKHQSAVTCLQSSKRFVITSSDDGTVKLWDLRTGEFIRNLVELESGGSGGVIWRIRASATKLICAVGSRNGTEETKLMVLNFDVPGACQKCNN